MANDEVFTHPILNTAPQASSDLNLLRPPSPVQAARSRPEPTTCPISSRSSFSLSTNSSSDHGHYRTQHHPRHPLHRRLLAHLRTPIPSSNASAFLLLLLTICTGIQDATTFPDYHCFASNQTGNTIFLTLAVVLPELNKDMFVTANIGVALAFFLLGAWLTGQLGHITTSTPPAPQIPTEKPSPQSPTQIYTPIFRTRLFLLLSNTTQTILILLASLLQFRYGVTLTSTPDLIVIGLLAFASGSQVVQSRSLGMTEISTAMATAAWVDLVVDPCLFSVSLKGRKRGKVSVEGGSGDGNGEKTGKRMTNGRNRRVLFLLALVIGGFIGAVLYRWAGSAVAILVSAIGKAVVCVGWLVIPGDGKEVRYEEDTSTSSEKIQGMRKVDTTKPVLEV
jgi:uncharacterized membrane protein YoaK (UPF0700 family)